MKKLIILSILTLASFAQVMPTPEMNEGVLTNAQNQKLTSEPVVVNIISEPSKAKIFIDGESKGITNKGIFLNPGKYLLRLELEGYLALEDTISVAADQAKNSFKYTLTKNSGVFDLKVSPEDAVVRLNDQVLLKPYYFEIKPGEYNIKVEAPLYDTFNEKIKLNVGQTISRKIDLVKNSGNLILTVQPIGATVKIAGKIIEDYNNLLLSPGKYEFEVSYPEYSTQKWVTEIMRGKTETIKVVLAEKTGNLQFSISPMEANISLRKAKQEIQKWTGSTIISKLRIGDYLITAKCPGYKNWSQIINIKEGETTILDVQMLNGSAGPAMVLVAGGRFNMGCTSEIGDCDYDEYPVRTVTISDFYMAETELTVDKFKDFIDATGYKTIAEKEGVSLVYNNGSWTKQYGVNWRYDAKGNPWAENEDSYPVLHVSWYDAIEYCNWLSLQDGLIPVYTINRNSKDPNNKSDMDQYKWLVSQNTSATGYRLPTEAEWEYAARGGVNKDGFSYSGDNKLTKVGWAISNSNNELHSVKMKAPNSLGLYDLSGNVWEWCWDWYAKNHPAAATNPTGHTLGEARVLRGGAWDNDETFCRVSGRIGEHPSVKYPIVGFRIVAFGKPGLFSGSQSESPSYPETGNSSNSIKKTRKVDQMALTNQMILEMYDIVKHAQKYYTGSKSSGNGGDSFIGYTLSSTAQNSTVGKYSMQIFADMIILTGDCIELNESGNPVAKVILMFNKDEIKNKQVQ